MNLFCNVISYLLAALTVALVLGMISCRDADSRRLDQIPPYIHHKL